MKGWKLFEALGRVDEKFVEEARPGRALSKRLPWRKAGAIAAGLAVIVGGIALAPHLRQHECVEINPPALTDEAGRLLWVDTRERNGIQPMAAELAIVWPWADLTPVERYTTLRFDGKTYVSRGKILSGGYVGDAPLGDGTAYGWEFGMEDKEHSLGCTVWPIAPFDATNRLVAVRLEESSDFIVFREEAYNPPENLGAMLEEYRLETTLAIDYFRRSENNFMTDRFTLPAEAQSKLWGMLARSAEALPQENLHNIDMNGISCSVSSPAMGIENRSLSITEEGWLLTNFADYGYSFFIGRELAGKIIDFVTDQAGGTYIPPETHTLAGVITEIGDGYFKLDDSLLMADRAEGMVFTVSSVHPHVARYFANGMLQVGDTVLIRHDGLIYADRPTAVNGAYGLDECIITQSGEVLIPE